jgi:NAD(P)-dependent dehydrogenase (short-subunit alcohol dehydrogenase family)
MSRIIVVTGGAQGIGKAIVTDLLCDKETLLYVIDKQETQFITECMSEYPERFTFFHQDIADQEGLDAVLGNLQTLTIDGVVNNAGEVYFEEWDVLRMDTWDRTFAVNVRAPLHIIHSLRDAFKNGASIVNIASTDRDRAAFTTIPYAASKAALANLTMSLAAVLGNKEIRVNAIAPGWVETEMTKDTMPDESTWITRRAVFTE